MRVYKLMSNDSSIEGLGDLSREQIMPLLTEADEDLRDDKEQFSIGLYRSEADYIEITPVGNSEYQAFSDIIARKQSWKEYFFQQKFQRTSKPSRQRLRWCNGSY